MAKEYGKGKTMELQIRKADEKDLDQVEQLYHALNDYLARPEVENGPGGAGMYIPCGNMPQRGWKRESSMLRRTGDRLWER